MKKKTKRCLCWNIPIEPQNEVRKKMVATLYLDKNGSFYPLEFANLFEPKNEKDITPEEDARQRLS